MSADRDDQHGLEPVGEDDAVATFFAAARAQVRDEAATDLDWQRVVHQARGAHRRRSRTALLSSAAVAVIAVLAVLVWQQQGITGGVQRGQAIAGSNTVTHLGGASSTPSSVSGAQNPTMVPKSFQTWSVSNAGQSTLYALGSQTCGGDTCPVLLRSNNNGGRWNAVHKFTGTDVSAATDTSDVPQIQPQRAITQARFATPQVGFVFGGDLWVTRDSGSSFTTVSHPGTTVLDVEMNQGQAVLLSADNCGQGECYGPVYVTRFNPTAASISQTGAAQLALNAPISAGTVLVQNGRAFVQLTDAGSSTPLSPMRLDGSKLQRLAAPTACAGTQVQSMTAATNTGALLLFGLCNPQKVAGNKRSYTIVRSDDAGNNWRSVSSGALSLPNLGQVWLAAADANHLVASAGGPRNTNGVQAASGAGSLMVSSTTSKGFGPATPPPGQQLPPTGFDWTASAGGGLVYAVPRTTHGFWMTTDYGKSWTLVDPRS